MDPKMYNQANPMTSEFKIRHYNVDTIATSSKPIDEVMAPKFAEKYSAKEIEDKIFPKLPRGLWLMDFEAYGGWVTHQMLWNKRRAPYYLQVVLSELLIVLIMLFLIWFACSFRPMNYKHLFNYEVERYLTQDFKEFNTTFDNIETLNQSVAFIILMLRRANWWKTFAFNNQSIAGKGDDFGTSNLIISPPQLRIKSVQKCDDATETEITKVLQKLHLPKSKKCYPEYSVKMQKEINKAHPKSWYKYLDKPNITYGYSPNFTGEFASYDLNNTYYFLLSNYTKNDYLEAKNVTHDKKLGQDTRVLIFEFALYCLDLDSFAYVRFVFERGAGGSEVVFTPKVYSVNFLNKALTNDCLYGGILILILIIAIYYAMEELRELFFLKLRYFIMPSTYVDLLIITVIGFSSYHFISVIISNESEERIHNRIHNVTMANLDQFVFFDTMDHQAKHQEYLIFAFALLVVRLLRYLHVFVTFQTYFTVQTEVFMCIALLCCLTLGLACMAHLSFGLFNHYYYGFLQAICSTIGFWTLYRDYRQIEIIDRYMASVFICFACIGRILMILWVIPLAYKITQYTSALSIIRGRTGERVAFAPCYRMYYLSRNDEHEAMIEVLQRKLMERGFGFSKIETEVFLKRYYMKIDSNLNLHDVLKEKDLEDQPSYEEFINRAIREGETAQNKGNAKKSRAIEKKEKKNRKSTKTDNMVNKDWNNIKDKINSSEILLEICIERMIHLEDLLFMYQRLLGSPEVYDRKRIFD